MKEISIPVYSFKEEETAEVEVTIGKKKTKYYYRVESFICESGNDKISYPENKIHQSDIRISKLKNAIQAYDPDWELMQIFSPSEGSKYIQVLYRKK